MNVFSVALCEKITCCSEHIPGYGGFLGGVYVIEGHAPKKIGSFDNPISFASISKSKCCSVRSKQSTGQNDYECLVGDWEGYVYFRNEQVRVSNLPIKFALRIQNYLIVSDSNCVFLVESSALSSIPLGTFALQILAYNEIIVCICGYKIVYLRLNGPALQEISTKELQRGEAHTETLTCIAQDGVHCFGGTIGGYICQLSDWESPAECRMEKLLHVSDEKITDIICYACTGRRYWICTTPTNLIVVDSYRKQSIYTLPIQSFNGLCSVRVVPNQPGIFAVGDINFKVHLVDIKEVFGIKEGVPSIQENTSKKADDIYNDLLNEINSGAFD